MGHAHGHTDSSSHTRAFAVSVVLNVAFVVVEVVYGLLSGSMALVADAAHNLGDVLGLGLAWGATMLARIAPDDQRTYGWRKSTVLAALLNGLLIVLAIGGVAWEAIERLRAPTHVDGWTMIVVALVGVVINTASAALFYAGRKRDANIRGAFLHLAADAAVSVGVVVAGIGVLTTGIAWIDPATSLLISAVILYGTWDLLRESIALLLDAVPAHIELPDVRRSLSEIEGVLGVHDLHVWAMSTADTALTAHVAVDPSVDPAELLRRMEQELHDRFHIEHTTIQFEPSSMAEACDQCRPNEPASA